MVYLIVELEGLFFFLTIMELFVGIPFFCGAVLNVRLSGTALTPFRTAVPFWGQTIQSPTSLSPHRDCGYKGVNITAMYYQVFYIFLLLVLRSPRTINIINFFRGAKVNRTKY